MSDQVSEMVGAKRALANGSLHHRLYNTDVARFGDSSLSRLLEHTMATVHELFDASRLSLMLVNDQQELIIHLSVGLPPQIVREARRKLGEGISGWVAMRGEPILINGPVVGDLRFEGVDPSITTALSVPLIVEDKTIGVLNLGKTNGGRPFSRQDLEIASLIATALAVAVEAASACEKAQEDSRQAFILFELTRACAEATSLAEAFEIIVGASRSFVGADFCALLELNSGRWLWRAIDNVQGAFKPREHLPLGRYAWLDRCLASCDVVVIDCNELGDEGQDMLPSAVGKLSVLPIRSADRTIGILLLGFRDDAQLKQRFISSLKGLAAQVANVWEVINRRQAWEEQIASKERHRIAQELHDHLAQELSSLVFAIESSQLALKQNLETTQSHLAKASRMARECLNDVRQLMKMLRSSSNDIGNLTATLRHLVEDFQARTGTSVAFTVLGAEERLAPDVQQTFLRVAQEGLNNIRKHTAASAITLQLAYLEGEGRLVLTDNGAGFDVNRVMERAPIEGKYGLLGMRERALAVGGTLDITSKIGGGTRIELRVPTSDIPATQ